MLQIRGPVLPNDNSILASLLATVETRYTSGSGKLLQQLQILRLAIGAQCSHRRCCQG